MSDDPNRMRLTTTVIDEARPMTSVEFERGMGILLDRVSALCDARMDIMEAAMRRGSAAGIVDVLANKDHTSKFWKSGFDELRQHTSNHASQWIGRRVLTWVVVAVLSACLAWLVQTGRLK